MSLRDDSRGQAIQIGAVLLLGALVLAFSLYQAVVVPDQNRAVEFSHNQKVQGQLQDVRNAFVSTSDGGGSTSVAVALGTQYPSRLIALNPAPPSGTLRTVGTTNATVNVTVANATASGETGDFWDGTARTYNTGAVAYRPGYNEYGQAPTTWYENSVLYNRFRDTNLTLTGQQLVEGTRISLVTLNGSFYASQAGTASMDVRPASAAPSTVTVTNGTGGNVTVTVPTRLPASTWRQLLDGEFTPAGHVVRIETTPLADGDFRLLTVVFERGVDYQLQLSRAGVGTGVRRPPAAYLTDVSGNGTTVPEGGTATLTVEVRDRLDNPEGGVRTVAGTLRPDSSVDPNLTDSEGNGEVTLTYEAPADVSGSSQVVDVVNASIDPNVTTSSVDDGTFDPESARNVSLVVRVDNTDGSGLGGGTGGPYNVSWLDPTEPGVTCSPANDPDGTCTVDASQTTSATLPVGTDPNVDGATIDFSVGNTTVGTVTPGTNTTDASGETTTTFTPVADGTTTVYATGGGSGDALDVRVINAGAGDFLGEIGTTTITQSSPDAWTRIDLQGVYDNPVVIAKPTEFPATNDESAYSRVRNVGPGSFEIKIEEWDNSASGQDDVHPTVNVSYLVFEEGTHELRNGSTIDVGTTSLSGGSYRTVGFNQSFSGTPVVFSQSQTYNDPADVVVRQRNVGSADFEAKFQEDDGLTQGGHGTETLGYVAIEVNRSINNGSEWESGRTASAAVEGVEDYGFDPGQFYQQPFTRSFDRPPALIAQMQTENGGDTAFERYGRRNATDFRVAIDETPADGERTHPGTETVGYFAFERTGPIYENRTGGDTTAPTVSSITRSSPSSATTNADTVEFEVEFSETVQNVDDTDFNLNTSGTTGTVSSVNTSSGRDVLVTVSSVSGDGTLGLDVSSGSDITDTAGNSLDTSEPSTDEVYTIDNTAPTVDSIVRSTPSTATTNDDTVEFEVTFSETVQNIDTTDFALNTSGTSGTITSVGTSSGSSVLVTVSSVSGDGTLGLNVSSGSDIEDLAGNALDTTEPSTDERYTVDNTAPTISSTSLTDADGDGVVNSGDSITIRADVSDANGVSSVEADASDFGAGTVSLSPVSGTTYEATVQVGSSGSLASDGDYPVDVTATDTAGNSQTVTTSDTLTIDTTAPTVSSITRSSPTSATTSANTVEFEVEFSETVENIDTTDFALDTSGTSGTITSVNTSSGSDVIVNVSSVSGDGTLGLNVSSGSDITDSTGNSLDTTEPSTDEVYTIDNTTPTVDAILRSSPSTATTNANTVEFEVEFSETVQNVDTTDFALNTSGTSGTISSVNTSSGSDVIVNVSSVSGDGTLGLNVTSTSDIEDAAGNSLDTTEPATDERYTIDNTTPTVDAILRSSPSSGTTSADTVEFEVEFSETVQNIDTSDFALNTSGTSGTFTSVNTSSGSDVIVNVSSVSGDGTLGLNVSSGSDIEDQAGNALDTTEPSTDERYTIDNTGPTISNVALGNDGSNNLTLTFDSDEQLSSIGVSVDGPSTTDVYTFDETDFSESGSGPYTYTLTADQRYDDGEGNYTATVDSAVDAVGNDGATGETDTYTFPPSLTWTRPPFAGRITAGDLPSPSAPRGTEFQVRATDGADGVENVSVSYSSGDTSVATVDASGTTNATGYNGTTVTHQGDGRVTLTATSGVTTGQVTVTVDRVLAESFEDPAETLRANGWFYNDSGNGGDAGIVVNSTAADDGSRLAFVNGDGTSDTNTDTPADSRAIELNYSVDTGAYDALTVTYVARESTRNDNPDTPDSGDANWNPGENLYVQYYSAGGTWVTVDNVSSRSDSGGGQTYVRRVSIEGIANATHPGFKLRFRQGDTTATDEWTVDSAAVTGITTASVADTNQDPVPEFTYSPSRPFTGQQVSFDAARADDPDGSITSYEWDFDEDGTTDATGRTPTYSFGSTGTYNVTLTVTDDGGDTATRTRTVEVVGPFSTTYVSSMVPNAGPQRQNVTFVPSTDVPSGESVYLVFDDPQKVSPEQVNYAISATKERNANQFTVENSNSNSESAFVELRFGSGLPAGTPIEVRIGVSSVGNFRTQTDPYNVTINRTDVSGASTNATFRVDYDSGDPALSSTSADNLTAGVDKSQIISFTPDRQIAGDEKVYVDLSLAQNDTGSYVGYNNSGVNNVNVGSATFSVQDPDNASLAYTAPSSGVSAGTTVDIEVTGIKAVLDNATSATFEIGYSREDADTTNATFTLKNDPSAIQFNNLQGFEGNATTEQFTIDQVDIQVASGNYNLDRIVYEVTDPGGNVVASRTDDASGNTQYQVSDVTLSANSDVKFGTTYTLNVTAYDAVGNRDNRTRTDTTKPATGANVIKLVSGSGTKGGEKSSTVTFDVKNIADSDVTVRNVTVVDTDSGSPRTVGNGRKAGGYTDEGAEFSSNRTGALLDTSSPFPIGTTETQPLDTQDTVSGKSGTEYTVEEFRNNGNNEVDPGAFVTIRLGFTDGTTKQFTVSLPP